MLKLMRDQGRAPIAKNSGPNHFAPFRDWGVTPIEKNIRVVDEHGNNLESTWPRRARGLVKNGRARFISEDTIVLRAPPKENMEENNMSKQGPSFTGEVEYSIPYILYQISLIQADSAYLSEVAGKLAAMSDGDSGEPGSPGNMAGAAKAAALGDIIQCRETTNQQVLRLYEKMYDKLTDM